jgi:hypothetical protein
MVGLGSDQPLAIHLVAERNDDGHQAAAVHGAHLVAALEAKSIRTTTRRNGRWRQQHEGGMLTECVPPVPRFASSERDILALYARVTRVTGPTRANANYGCTRNVLVNVCA